MKQWRMSALPYLTEFACSSHNNYEIVNPGDYVWG